MLIYLQMAGSDEDKRKFEQLYQKYRWLMFSVANQILENTQDAEDAVHQAFLYIAENLHKVQDISGSKTRAYLVIITEHKAIDIMRTNAAATATESIDTLQGVEVHPPPGSGLAEAMARIPAQYREVLLLRFAYGYSTKEIGKLFGASPQNVQRMIWRAKAALQARLEEDEAT